MEQKLLSAGEKEKIWGSQRSAQHPAMTTKVGVSRVQSFKGIWGSRSQVNHRGGCLSGSKVLDLSPKFVSATLQPE